MDIDNILNLYDFDQIKSENPEFYIQNDIPIQKNEVNIFSAKGGSGKSYLLSYLMLLLSVKENLRCFGWFSEDKIGVTKSRVERDPEITKLHIKNNIQIAGKENIPLQLIHGEGHKYKVVVHKDFQKLKKQLDGFDVILLDPLLAFYGADENNNSNARFFMSLLNEWAEESNKTMILTHHHSKSETPSARGAGAFIDACRMHYVISRDKNDKCLLNLELDKSNHFQQPRRRITIKILDNVSNSNYNGKL